MKNAATVCFAAALAASAAAAPRFVTPQQTLRNGLTDEQYERLWAQGRRPQIEPAAARDWIFRASRFRNVTNWLGVVGASNDFARLVYPTMTTNEWLTATNRQLSVANASLRDEVRMWYGEYTNQVAATGRAEDEARGAREIRKAAKRAEKNLKKVVKEMEKARKKAATPEEQSLWSALIAILEGKEPN